MGKCMQEIINKWPSYNDYLLPIITIPGKKRECSIRVARRT